MQYIEAVSEQKAKHNLKLFLAGGITGCKDWQKTLVKEMEKAALPVTVFNPRRENFPIEDPNAAEEQIDWEHRKLREADVISFWFCRETMCPIVLWECGAALERDQEIIIGMDEDYKRRQDVEIQTKLMDPIVEVHIGFESFQAALLKMLGRLVTEKPGERLEIDQGHQSTL